MRERKKGLEKGNEPLQPCHPSSIPGKANGRDNGLDAPWVGLVCEKGRA
jgi:hypothetical protein